MNYIELQVTSHFSFLRGASSCDELFGAAAALGYPTLAITDHGTVAGLVRGLVASEATGVRLIAGCRLNLVDGPSLLVWPQDKAAWSRLTRLLTLGKSRAVPKKGEKGKCFLHWEDVALHADGLIAALVSGTPGEETVHQLGVLRDIFGARGYMTLTRRYRLRDTQRLYALDALAKANGVPSVITGDVIYHEQARHRLQDVMTAIRHGCLVEDLGFKREHHAGRYLISPARAVERHEHFQHAMHATLEIAERCTFSLRELGYQYPDEVVMSGRTPQEALARMSRDALAALFPSGVPDAYSSLLDHELGLVDRMGYAPYFLTVHTIVSYAKSQGILCQGRGSAANSVICYVLGITTIDPVKHELLFERFVSEERREPPDIDVDFEHERREEVIQWIYETYGHRHAALTAVVTRYRTRGAVREVGKVLGLPEDVTGTLAGQVWGWSSEGVSDRQLAEVGMDRSDHRMNLAVELSSELLNTPRHLSQHPGGFVLTRDRLDDLVPIEPAAMDDRRVIEWDKDDINELGFMKVDVLGLGMLGCMRRAFGLLEEHKGICIGMADLQTDDPDVYAMIQKADTLGVFQIESRAQMSMLPRIKPKEFYDLVIEVAIVRPGPIQGDMVHPYLRRREGKEAVVFPSEDLKKVLGRTLGVPLFQEQAMKVAIVGAGFTAAEADQLRRAMATFKFTGGVGPFRDKLINGMIAKGYERDFAERTFRQLEGFGSYGFPESHAASFAKIAYASCWMKHHHPDIFCAALLNAQPMGFYAPAQIVRDAREHGVEIRPVCINASRWDCTIEEEAGRYRAVRLGLRMVRGLANEHAGRIVAAREMPFQTIEDAWRAAGVPTAAFEKLADADAFRMLGLARREALWNIRALGQTPLPLFAWADARELGNEPSVTLRPMSEGADVVEDYRAVRLSLRDHPVSFIRARLDGMKVLRCGDLANVRDGKRVHVAGLVLVRQRPGAGNVTFITLEDETGIANIIVWQRRYEAFRRVVHGASLMRVRGHVQKEGIVIHVIADELEDCSSMLAMIDGKAFAHQRAPADGGGSGNAPDSRGRPQKLADRAAGLSIRSRDFR
jgi:error-prone DNA polymerase